MDGCLHHSTCSSLTFVRPGDHGWAATVSKANEWVTELAMEEWIALIKGNGSAGACTGNLGAIPRMGFNGICMPDGPTTVVQTDLVSIFPAALTAGATWDKDLMYRRGVAIGEDFKGKGANVAIA